eukprot:6488430-Amphidinium_carterae.4
MHSVFLARHPVVRLYGFSCVTPHTAVCCSLEGIGPGDVVRVPRKRKAFAEEVTIGPAPYIEDPVWWHDPSQSVEEAWQEWMRSATCVH